MRVSDMLEVARIVSALGRVERITQNEDGTRESVTTHTVMLAICAGWCAESCGMDAGHAMWLALCHDMPEAICGDTPTLKPLTEEQAAAKRDAEHAAIDAIGKVLPPVAEACRLHDERSSPEARLVHVLDKVMPRLMAGLNGGTTIREHGLSLDDVLDIMRQQDADLAMMAPDLCDVLHVSRGLVGASWAH